MGGEVVLRDVEEADLPTFFQQQRDPEATRMAAFEARDPDAFAAHWARILADQAVTKQTILLDGEVAGNIVSFERSGRRELGYWIGREHWGKGVATRALSAFLDQVKTRPLYAHVAKDNVASIRVLEKCGFTVTEEDEATSGADDDVEELLLVLRA